MLFFYCFLQSKTFFNIQVKKKEKNQKKKQKEKNLGTLEANILS